mmetsp:Transcript_22087/g.30821  ORF Transcript_22087/g.30821 Transcript_22087/m.30821 type:complete len:117 (-) Transcript_22087:11-361(-)
MVQVHSTQLGIRTVAIFLQISLSSFKIHPKRRIFLTVFATFSKSDVFDCLKMFAQFQNNAEIKNKWCDYEKSAHTSNSNITNQRPLRDETSFQELYGLFCVLDKYALESCYAVFSG